MSCYRASQNRDYNGQGVLQEVYPPPPSYSPGCPSNRDYDTLPPGYPMRKTILGPNSLKHLYRGPWYYPPQSMNVPKGSMYDYDTNVYGPHGIRLSYGAKMYPYQHRSPREVREYTTNIGSLPNQFEWTKYNTVSDGAWGK